jgi:HSP20 family protein
MADPQSKVPVKTEKAEGTLQTWRPFESLRREMDRLFDDFEGGFWSSPFRRSLSGIDPFWRRGASLVAAPAVDVAESDKAFEITAELPGMSEKDLSVTLASGALTIKGEKSEEKEEKKKDYYVSERRYGSFERSFQVPDGVDTDKVEASFKNGVLKVTLPKTAEAQKAVKQIAVKTA